MNAIWESIKKVYFFSLGKCNGRQFIFFGCVGGWQKPRTCGDDRRAFYNVFQQTIHFYLAFVCCMLFNWVQERNSENDKLFLIQYRSSYLRRENIFVQFCKNYFFCSGQKKRRVRLCKTMKLKISSIEIEKLQVKFFIFIMMQLLKKMNNLLLLRNFHFKLKFIFLYTSENWPYSCFN